MLSPLALSDDSEPEPDVAVVPPGDHDIEHPRTALLVIEVSDSSLKKDRTKAAIYASAGIGEYWIVNLGARTVEVYSSPDGDRYAEARTLREGDTLRPAGAARPLDRRGRDPAEGLTGPRPAGATVGRGRRSASPERRHATHFAPARDSCRHREGVRRLGSVVPDRVLGGRDRFESNQDHSRKKGRVYMTTRGIVFAAAATLAVGCAEQPDETREIVENLVQAGFPADDIAVVDGVVYVGRDAEVSLAASREMLQAGDSSEEQYRTTNRISTSLSKICIDGSTFTGVFSTALDLAIQNYDELPLRFAMARTPSTGCSFTINAVIQPGTGGGTGYPSGGLPYPTITIGDGLAALSVDVMEHLLTHEIGHTIGFRHSDYYNRNISCGSDGGGNEGDPGVGAIYIPGTPTDAVVGGSIMNTCIRTDTTGEFTSSDVTALTELYVRPPIPNPITKISEYCMGFNTIYWTSQPGATYYELHRSLSSSFTSPVVIYSGPATEAFINVSMNSVWYLRAKACHATAGCSDYSSQISATYWTSYCQ